MKDLIAAVWTHALKGENYNKGWDVVVECMDDRDIEQIILRAKTPLGALRKMSQYVSRHEANRREITNA